MDDAFSESLAGFKGEWSRELLMGCRLSEMGKYAPSVCAIPNGTTDPAYSKAWAELDAGWAEQMLKNCQSPHLQPEVPRRPLGDGWDFKKSSRRRSKPSSMLPIAWQLENIGFWEMNFRCVLQNLGPRTNENSEMLDTFDLITYELIPLLRRFRPTRTASHLGYENVRDDQTGSWDEHYCELCWRLTVRSVRLEEIRRLTLDDRQRSRERIKAGRHSNRYCSLHMPGTAQYHADLRYKAAFQRHLDTIFRGRVSDYAFNLQPPSSPDTQELRKLAYDQVHSGLHAITPKEEKGLGLREKVWLMYREGLSQSEMARRLGISRQAISKAKKSLESLMNVHHAGCYLNPITGEAQVPARVLDEIRGGLRRGLPIAAIAKAVGLSKGTVDGLTRLIDDS
ncbi:RNA polymerase sigma factor [Aquipseudomonas campi]